MVYDAAMAVCWDGLLAYDKRSCETLEALKAAVTRAKVAADDRQLPLFGDKP